MKNKNRSKSFISSLPYFCRRSEQRLENHPWMSITSLFSEVKSFQGVVLVNLYLFYLHFSASSRIGQATLTQDQKCHLSKRKIRTGVALSGYFKLCTENKYTEGNNTFGYFHVIPYSNLKWFLPAGTTVHQVCAIGGDDQWLLG